MWSINVKFLRGVCVATDTGQWEEVEWPPHPARLFMAMAAAYFETLPVGKEHVEESACRNALEWLESQPAPRILAPPASTRTSVTVYVPVNDSTKNDQLFTNARSRQPRFFPTSVPEADVLHYVFDSVIEKQHIGMLEEVAAEVVRIGHSSSLTQVWIESEFEYAKVAVNDGDLIEWAPASSEDNPANQFRVTSSGTLKSLEDNYNLAAIEEYIALQDAMNDSKGAEKSRLKAALAERFPNGMPSSQRPQQAKAIGYVQNRGTINQPSHSYFDTNLMVLSLHESPQIGLESTLQLAGAVRKRIHDSFPGRTSPEWLGGHKSDGSPAVKPHVAIVPLPFVDHPHADGHLMGLALAFPRNVSEKDRAIALRGLFERTADSEWILPLRLNEFRLLTGIESHCDIVLVREQRLSPPRTLEASTWTAASSVWESVTPIVLDRFPKRDPIKERAAWHDEVGEIIAGSCENIGLPCPGAIHVHHNAFVTGVPKSRPRGGFPAMGSRPGKASRFQIHARIEFDIPVVGPVILGAGRFVGYGFCRPSKKLCRKRRGF